MINLFMYIFQNNYFHSSNIDIISVIIVNQSISVLMQNVTQIKRKI